MRGTCVIDNSNFIRFCESDDVNFMFIAHDESAERCLELCGFNPMCFGANHFPASGGDPEKCWIWPPGAEPCQNGDELLENNPGASFIKCKACGIDSNFVRYCDDFNEAHGGAVATLFDITVQECVTECANNYEDARM